MTQYHIPQDQLMNKVLAKEYDNFKNKHDI